MPSSLVSGLSGLRSHQNWIDVIGHNLANASTPGFKSSRALFADLISRTLRPASAPTPTFGGTNPVQVGLGVDVGHVDRDMGQGAMNVTGRTFDLALSGGGFFGLTDGTQSFYTRVGTFGLDAAGNMVDLVSGYRVLGANGQPFRVDTGVVVPPRATGEVGFRGNLPAEVTGPLAEELSSSTAFAEGSAAQLSGTSAEPFAIPVGETWTMELVIDGGAPQTVSVTSTSGSVTAAELAQAIDQLDHVGAQAVGGAVQLTTDRTGSQASIKVNPGSPGDLAALAGLSTSLVTGTETAATQATDLNALTGNLSDYQVGDRIDVSGTDADGSAVQASFEYGVDGTTLGDLVAFVDAQYAGASAAFDDASGQIRLTADQSGDADLSITLLDPASQAGSTDWAEHAFAVTTDGAGPDTLQTSIEVFDAAGTAHLVNFAYERQEDGTWNLTADLPPSEGTVVAGTVTGIRFNADGSLATPASGQVSLQFTGQPAQDLTLDLGSPGQLEGITQFGSGETLLADSQDGYGAGELQSLSVAADGTIEGFFSNGQLQSLGQFGVATFSNQQGLSDLGNNMWAETANSGTRRLGAGATGPAGEVIGGALEDSNVDTASEFVHLIQAQRGFQANARIITIQDELLAEVVNLV